MNNDNLNKLEAVVRILTTPDKGRYPRPWMTSLVDPSKARVFSIGRNPAKNYLASQVGPHQRYVDALFNRGEEGCRELYDRLHPKPSPTRLNTDMLVSKLADRGIVDVIETNVVCFSTPMSRDLAESENLSGAAIGREIFAALYKIVRPKVIIAHGAGTVKELGHFLGVKLPSPPHSPTSPVHIDLGGVTIFSIPSLAPPKFNTWKRWSQSHLNEVADAVKAALVREENLWRT